VLIMGRELMLLNVIRVSLNIEEKEKKTKVSI
jgi:hypothetical protein